VEEAQVGHGAPEPACPAACRVEAGRKGVGLPERPLRVHREDLEQPLVLVHGDGSAQGVHEPERPSVVRQAHPVPEVALKGWLVGVVGWVGGWLAEWVGKISRKSAKCSHGFHNPRDGWCWCLAWLLTGCPSPWRG
jgi:hypothetical protein